ncbi:hypothetical protein Trco_008177 [Trichoderma cornu-damae]|uniref:Uncharacterized protein n=1 Tax=Trichoderma cornu-damae TaxID=654480 RepID=A0A9P8QJC4_9HYPO|nr:hypothetical protein Trco_008177 [Trichoderma cornu-damae]
MSFHEIIILSSLFIAFLLVRRWRTWLGGQADSVIALDARQRSRLAAKLAERVTLYKEMYHKVQNLEEFPEVLPAAKEMLLELLEHGLSMARFKPPTRSILDLKEYDPVALDKFLEAERQDVSDEFESYVRKREAGSPRELFNTKADAIQWLKRLAPLNLIDGAWLCRVHKITTPFALREVTKNAWQVFSEELGDGDMEKNHVLIYRDLLREHGVDLPASDSLDFIQDSHGLNDEQVWRSSIGQLLISLFPNEFLPEILGLNLHFEALAPTGLKASKEFPEVGISAYYFALHISIDNADSGHSGMALANIVAFMDLMRKTGLMDCGQAWKRIQAGYLLSQSLDEKETPDVYEEQLIQMLHRKANLARKIHCTSRARIGGKGLTEWFSSPSPDSEKGDEWKHTFLHALADSRPWVRRGNSRKSLLVKELSWTGRMFGAFTDSEVGLLRTWIDSLREKDACPGDAYWKTVGGHTLLENSFLPSRRDVAVTHPVFSPQQACPPSDSHDFAPLPALQVSQVRLGAILPLWFVHPCVLENMVVSPYRTASTLTSKTLQIIRAEMGYSPENTGIAGMDEQLCRGYRPDLVALGCEMARRHNVPEPTCLGDIIGPLDEDSPAVTKFAHSLLNWSMRPHKNGVFLLGLARAFLDMEVLVAADESLLSKGDRKYLWEVIERKRVGFEACLTELVADPVKSRDFVGGYQYGRAEIEKILA